MGGSIRRRRYAMENMVTTRGTEAGLIDRIMVEYCCSRDSTHRKFTTTSKGWKAIRVHEHLNANSKECEEMVLDELKSVRRGSPHARMLVCAALPCTGGSSWQYVNEANGPDEKVQERKKTFRRLLSV